jgi:2-keto-4-pentenoate hydratase/2-oxohepta-3-ene-1,7-dioic acid hydratase in catechol pathway
MRLVTFRANPDLGQLDRIGALIGDELGLVLDLNLTYAAYLESVEHESHSQQLADLRIPHSMIGLIEGGEPSTVACKNAINYASDMGEEKLDKKSGDRQQKLQHKLSEVSLLAPIPFPRVIMDFQTFEQHVLNFARKLGGTVPQEWYEMPGCYKKNPGSVIGHLGKVVKPSYTNELDYELELAIYIGKRGKNVKEKDAHQNIFGYSIFNDFSARDIQLKEMKINLGPFKGKDFDTSASFGPCLVTADEVKNPHDLKMSSYVNGKLISEGNSKNMRWSFEKLIEYSSMEETLYPGYILGSGTAGYGSGFENDIRLGPGDSVELRIEGLGSLKNEIIGTRMN